MAEYRSLCLAVSNTRCTHQQIETLKRKYKNLIESNRRYELIRTVPDLVKILQKRDAINENNTDILRDIQRSLPGDVVNVPYTNNRLGRQPVFQSTPSDIQERVYQRIGEEIGHNWKMFARALGIREGKIDDLEQRHPHICDRVIEILHYCERNCDQRRWRTSLLGALTSARRSDLQLQIAEIFDTHC